MADSSERLFFALWPDQSIRSALRQWQQQRLPGAGRWVQPGNLHITLLFVGSASTSERDCLCRQMEQLQANQFSLEINSTGCWQRPQVAWLGCNDSIPHNMRMLVQQLQGFVRHCGLHVDDREFVPHITMARKVRRTPWQQAVPDIKWHASEVVLVKSETLAEGVIYTPIDHWPLSP